MKNKTYLIYLCISTFVGCSRDNNDENQGSVTLKIQGQILNELVGKPIKYPSVQLFYKVGYTDSHGDFWVWTNSPSAWPADENGNFDFTYRIGCYSDSSVKIIAFKTGFEPKEIKLKCTNDIQIVNIKLMPTQSDYNIEVQGTVYNNYINPVKVSDALVILWEAQEQLDYTFKYYFLTQTQTDKNGFFKISYYVDYGCPYPAISASKAGLGKGGPDFTDCTDTLINQDIFIP